MFIESRLDCFNERLSGIEKKLDEISQRFREYNTFSKKWLTTKEVCQVMKCSPRFLQNQRDTGKIGFSRMSRKILYSLEDVEKAINDNKVNNAE